MFNSIQRYIKFYENSGTKTILVNNNLFREYQKMIIPIGPVKLDYSISKDDAKYLLSKFTTAIMIRSINNFDIEKNTDWFAVICDNFKETTNLTSNTRSEINKGLKNCIVEKVDFKFILQNGYNVYISAFSRYKNAKPINKNEFEQNILLSKDFEDIVHYWAVFEKSSNRLIAYSQNYIYDKIEANYSTIKFDPDYLRLYSSYALIYSMNKYYLYENNFEYVFDGFRSILHETNIQNYLIQKFNFRKAYTNIQIIYRPLYKKIISILFPFRSILGNFNPKIKAIFELENIRKKNL